MWKGMRYGGMKILVLGGTRFFGIDMVRALLEGGHEVTLAIRGNTKDVFESRVSYIFLDRHDAASVKTALGGKYFDIVIDKLAYCSNDVKYLLDAVRCGRYMQMSSTAVYADLAVNTRECSFNPETYGLRMLDREDDEYGEGKRQAECAAAQLYPGVKSVFVRYPVVLGRRDYTNRLHAYVQSICKRQPMYIDNMDSRLSFISSEEAGGFLAYLVGQDYTGAINGANEGTVSVGEILAYVCEKTGEMPVLRADGIVMPYNGMADYSVNVSRANQLGWRFTDVHTWIFELLDYYIERISHQY